MGRQTKKQRERKAQRKAGFSSVYGGPEDGGTPTVAVPNAKRREHVVSTTHSRKAANGDPGAYRRPAGDNPLGAVDPDLHKLNGLRPSPLQQEQARRRLENLNNYLQAKPMPILEQLKSVGIVPHFNHEADVVILSLREIRQADEMLAAKGTLFEQLYGKDVDPNG